MYTSLPRTIKNTNNYVLKEGDIVKYNKKFWYIDIIMDTRVVLARFKNNSLNNIKIETIIVKSNKIKSIKNTPYIDFLKSIYENYIKNFHKYQFNKSMIALEPGDFILLKDYGAWKNWCFIPGLVENVSSFNKKVLLKLLYRSDLNNDYVIQYRFANPNQCISQHDIPDFYTLIDIDEFKKLLNKNNYNNNNNNN